MSRRPDLFIIGAPKAGTSSLYDYLSGHPDIYMSVVKEPFYFATDFRRHRAQMRYPEDADRYLELFAGAMDEKRVGEASTGYLRSETAPGLVREFAPDAYLIAMLRDPVETLYAMHNERVSAELEDELDFEKALALDEERLAGRHLRDGTNALTSTYKDKARFAPQLQRWIDEFGRDRLHVIVLEEFAADPAGQFRLSLEFLQVDPDYQPASFSVSNASNRRRGGVVKWVVESRASKWARKKVMPALLGSEASARTARQLRQSRLVRKANPRQPIAAGLRRKIQDEFRDDVIAVSKIVGQDLEALWFDEGAPAKPEVARASS